MSIDEWENNLSPIEETHLLKSDGKMFKHTSHQSHAKIETSSHEISFLKYQICKDFFFVWNVRMESFQVY